MRSFFYFTMIVFFNNICYSQDLTEINNDVNSEVLSVFLLNMKPPYLYLDKNFSGKNFIKHFNSKYRRHLNIFQNSDSICKNSEEISKRKISCPLADSFKIYNNILLEEDLTYLSQTYKKNSTKEIINVKKFTKISMTLEHSDEFYKKMELNQNSNDQDIMEFPSIRIQNLYFNKEKDVAIIAYFIDRSIKNSNLNFFLLVRKMNLWWKPIGNLKI